MEASRSRVPYVKNTGIMYCLVPGATVRFIGEASAAYAPPSNWRMTFSVASLACGPIANLVVRVCHGQTLAPSHARADRRDAPHEEDCYVNRDNHSASPRDAICSTLMLIPHFRSQTGRAFRPYISAMCLHWSLQPRSPHAGCWNHHAARFDTRH